MAMTADRARLAAVAAIGGFIAGCWAGVGSTDGSPAYCVVTVASAPGRPGNAPGQFVPQQDGECNPGEPVVCGTFDGADDQATFSSDKCE